MRTLEVGDEEGEDHPSSHFRTSWLSNRVQQHRKRPFCVAWEPGPTSAAKALQWELGWGWGSLVEHLSASQTLTYTDTPVRTHNLHIHIDIYAVIHAHTDTHADTHAHKHMQICMHTHPQRHTDTHAQRHTCTQTHIHTCRHACTHRHTCT